MSFDDEFDEPFDDGLKCGETYDRTHQNNSCADEESSQKRLDPMDISDPVSAYFFLSDDVQDEIAGVDCKKMKCCLCGHRFWGDVYDNCPKCNSFKTEALFGDMDFFKAADRTCG